MKHQALALVAGLLALAVTGCAAQRRQEARDALAQTVEACRGRYPPNSHYLDKANCDSGTRRWALTYAGAPQDLVDLYIAKRALYAAQIDAGRISREEANVRISELAIQLGGVVADRNRSDALAAAAILGSMPRPQPYYRQPYVMPFQAPVTTNCMRIGSGMVSCYSN